MFDFKTFFLIRRLYQHYFLKLAFLPLILTVMVLAGCSANSARKVVNLPTVPSPGSINQNRVNLILKTAFSQMGNPYRYGGNSPETGFDCSGFVSWVYLQYGVSLPRSSRAMLAVGEPVAREDLRPGDLVFFNYGYSHVGIYTGQDKYIHSPRTGKRIQESDLNAKGRGDRFVGGRRIIDNQGVNAISDNLKSAWITQSRHQTAAALNEATATKHAGQSAAKRTASTGTASNKKGSAKTTVHKVVQGDNLVGISRRYGVTVNDLVAANGLRNRHKLSLGQKLTIPQKAPSQTTAKNKASNNGAKPKSKSKNASKPKSKS
ncbi:MAG: C40 family peptidase [Deltaproteobacteria bacterium]|jgi:LysM repeat protein|nr:C40 family peptidase [Deltaproteobacteria bacterium]